MSIYKINYKSIYNITYLQQLLKQLIDQNNKIKKSSYI